MKVFAVALTLASALGGTAFAQGRQPPSDTELRAFYCAPVATYLVELTKAIPRPPPDLLASNPKLAEEVRNNDIAAERFAEETRRLMMYVAIRSTNQISMDDYAAFSSGQKDVYLMKTQAESECKDGTFDERMACSSNYLKLSGLEDRIGRCKDISSWLPY